MIHCYELQELRGKGRHAQFGFCQTSLVNYLIMCFPSLSRSVQSKLIYLNHGKVT